ncbi:MAG: BRO family protein [Pseudomonadota bacterium]
MSGIVPFDFESYAIRVIMIDGFPWFVAADVCRALDHSNSRMALKRLDDDEKQSVNINTVNLAYGIHSAGPGNPNVTVISESGLYALIVTSEIKSARRFRKWVTSEVLPALRQHGSYAMPGPDAAELEAKRAYFEDLRPDHRDIADRKLEAIGEVNKLIADGSGVGAAIKEVAAEYEISERTLYNWRSNLYMVPKSDWGPALAPRWSGPRAMIAKCHPEAQAHFLDNVRRGHRISEAYRRMTAIAHERGWSPIPSEGTMRRLVQRQAAVAQIGASQ